MQDDLLNKEAVDAFIREEIDSVPHLEALLLIWRNRPRAWSVAEMAKALYVTEEVAEKILQGLAQRNLIGTTKTSDAYHYEPTSEAKDKLMAKLDETYRRELVRVSAMIHSKASAAVREFARAFRFKKDKD
jgi:predicted transcriptional regulator